ncbi:hypothetical protein ACHAXA_005067 [Cyclostephanos tholiformis]|uniref:Uncharacterized protein n=1 Tax=Cyclostephanos tholiformis TaxID=382380 RepID=A0ABD3SSJ9_9STRA
MRMNNILSLDPPTMTPNHNPSCSAGNDHDEDLPSTANLSFVLGDPNTKWCDIRAALKDLGRGSYVDGGGTRAVAATTNVGMLSALMMPRRGRRRGGSFPTEDDNRTASSLPEENHNGRCGEDEVKYHGEEEDANSSFEAKLATSFERRNSRRISAEGDSFKTNLTLVIEDAEADDKNDESIKRLSGDANDGAIDRGTSDFSESINIMDFGVDHWRSASSFQSLESESTLDSNLTSCVDSEGFLPWRAHPRRGSNTDSALKSSTKSSTQNKPSHSNSVDTRGVDSGEFLGLEESVRECDFGDPSATVHADSTTVDDEGEKKESKERCSVETWRIEDFEGSDNDAKRSRLGHMPFMKILSSLGMNASKSPMPIVAAAPADDSIKHILLNGRRSTANDAMLLLARNKATENADAAGSTRRKSTTASLFGKFRKGFDVSTSHKLNEYHCYGRSIHLSSGGVDIGGLRRDLRPAATEEIRRSL